MTPTPRPHGWRRLPRWAIPLACAWWLGCLVAFSNAGVNVLTIVAALLAGGLWLLVWAIRLLRHRYRRRRGIERGDTGADNSLYWCWEPLTLLLSAALSCSGALPVLRFALSEAALERYVSQVRAGEIRLDHEFRHPVRWVGLYPVWFTEKLPDGTVRLLTSADGLLDSAGFVHSRASPPPRLGEDSYRQLHGNWWRWRQSW